MRIITLLIIIILLLIFILLCSFFINMSINPKISHYTKYQLLSLIRDDVPDMVLIDKHVDNSKLFDTLKYPYVFKPNYCEDFAHQVEIIKNKKQAHDYLKRSIDRYIVVQKYHPGPHEGTVYYSRNPITNKVYIIVVERKQNDTKREWLWKSSIGYKYGYSTEHRKDLETEELKQKIMSISNKIPEFYLGRYDVRFENPETFKKGQGFKILELNKQGASDTRWNVDNSYLYNLRIFIIFVTRILVYGLVNILRGNTTDLKTFIYFCYKYLTKTTECQQAQPFKNQFVKLFKAFDII